MDLPTREELDKMLKAIKSDRPEEEQMIMHEFSKRLSKAADGIREFLVDLYKIDRKLGEKFLLVHICTLLTALNDADTALGLLKEVRDGIITFDKKRSQL